MTKPGSLAVTGAAGFIGGHVLEAATAAGWRVVPMIRPGSDPARLGRFAPAAVEGDLTDPRSLAAAVSGVDAVIHLAALTRAPSQAAFDRVNAEGVGTLAAALRQHAPACARILLVSSLAAGGPSLDGHARTEDEAATPVSAYGRSKLRGETALREAARGIPWTVVRPPIVYGAAEKDLLQLFRAARAGVVPIVGFRPKRYSVVYAPELARGIVDAVGCPAAAGRTYHLAEDRTYTYAEIALAIGVAVGRAPFLLHLPHAAAYVAAAAGSLVSLFRNRPALLTLDKLPEVLAPNWVCSPARAAADFGFRSRIDFAAGAVETARWYRSAGWL